MGKNKVKTEQPDVAFRYTPGDGRVYTWDGGPWIYVDMIVHHEGTPMIKEFRAVDQIEAPGERTATAMMDMVDAHRRHRA